MRQVLYHKADWPSHKQACGKPDGSAEPPSAARSSSAASALSPPKGLDGGISKPFSRLDDDTWLHGRSENDVYRLLIDACRLRAEDAYSFEGSPQHDSIYAGAPDGRRGFARFLDRAATRRGLLPRWWTPEKRAACERLGMDASQWHDLRCAVKKSDIIDHYGDTRFPMQLRMV
ncbi:Fatty-acid amide hydrolase [Tolypocladium capitatum]|uniref:Fatty-acid amide hydrolase n=1 Tax=Tolypocladium capitatum TaxID=45235 RepID=A0A2K3Q9F4_9HYPO|nr:Fatty-acid amide hydrolase [Tolypocladium capitatum]